MTGAAVLGSWPGEDLLAAQTVLAGELGGGGREGVTGLPGLVQLADGTPWSEPVARTAALLDQLPVELGPHGWRLCDRPGRDHERLTAAGRERIDALAVAGHTWAGPLVVEVGGPWTTAAVLYLARGDRVLSDPGAVRALAAGLVQGVLDLLGAVRGAVPGAEPVVVVHEPRLPDVLRGAVPDFSGHARLRSVPAETARTALGELVAAVRGADGSVVLHGGARPGGDALETLVGAGPDAVGVMVDGLTTGSWEQLAGAVEGGTRAWFGSGGTAERADPAARARAVSGSWTSVGLPARSLADVVVHGHWRGPGSDLRSEIATTLDVAARLADVAHG